MQIHSESVLIYKDLKKNDYPLFKHKIKIKIWFDYSPKVFIEFGDYNVEPYRVYMRDSSGNIFHTSEITTGIFTYAYRRWIDDTTITVHDRNGTEVANFNLRDKIRSGKVIICLESSSLGDTLAWMPYANKFIEENNCSDVTVTTFWNHIFDYDNIRFKPPGYMENDVDVIIGIGWYIEDDINYHRNDPRTCPLQKVASDILGVDYIGEIKPKIKRIVRDRPTDKRYVCIGTESTAAAKHWNLEGGWQTLVNLMKESEYEVAIIHKQGNFLSNVIDRTGDFPIEDRISDLINCEFFIGISSGLSWLAWALDVPVVMISGFTHKFCEFSDKTLRIINEDKCHGCFNSTENKFDRGDWLWCPKHKGTDRQFECTTSITPEQVFQSIRDWNFSDL